MTSTDGLLSAKVDAARGGVLLRANFAGELDPLPTCVRFRRGDGSLVRSGDPAWAPGGIAHAYDHEAPMGAVSYYVQPVTPDLAPVGDPSGKVALQVPWVGDPSDVWLKDPARPDLSLRVAAATFEEQGRPLRTTFNDVPGARLGLSSSMVTGGLSGTLTVKTDTKAEYDALVALMSGSTLLLQANPECSGVPEMYVRPTGDLASLRRVETGLGWAKRDWPIAVREVRRPATLDAPLRIPGLTWRSVAAQYQTWTNLAAQVGSWDELIWRSL